MVAIQMKVKPDWHGSLFTSSPVELMPGWVQSLNFPWMLQGVCHKICACLKGRTELVSCAVSVNECSVCCTLVTSGGSGVIQTCWVEKAPKSAFLSNMGTGKKTWFVSHCLCSLQPREAVWSWWLLACVDICAGPVWYAGAGYWNWIHDGVAGSILATWRR